MRCSCGLCSAGFRCFTQPGVVLAAGAFQIKQSARCASRNGPRTDSDTLRDTRRVRRGAQESQEGDRPRWWRAISLAAAAPCRGTPYPQSAAPPVVDFVGAELGHRGVVELVARALELRLRARGALAGENAPCGRAGGPSRCRHHEGAHDLGVVEQAMKVGACAWWRVHGGEGSRATERGSGSRARR